MPDDTVIKLRGRSNYELWNSSLIGLLDLTEDQTAMLATATSQQPAVGHDKFSRWYRNKCHVYNLLTKSLDDVVLSGLEAHGVLHATPWELYETIRTFCKPTPAHSIGLMDQLRDITISNSTTPAAFVAYVEFIRVSVEGDSYSMALTWLLFNAVDKTHPNLITEHGPVQSASDWTLLLHEVRKLPNDKKRQRPTSPHRDLSRDGV
ncbi:hypothetical protein CTA2_11534 [Colletotrichum tanaceti]|uniref:Uncharacterized protein n=1 Tax=Colletotrichum tanaceti TaxID=1306861 RepID=A0A4V6DH53_9PEZI|nr:hypothetical protein CTA2_11534 [Colletotrichum tanaceti]TKW55216.1 hypothetical protein CTA1_9423 [Colletotrichum tanaceti]